MRAMYGASFLTGWKTVDICNNSQSGRKMSYMSTTESIDYKRLYEDQQAMRARLESEVFSLQKTIDTGTKYRQISNAQFEYMANLQYKVKNLGLRVREFETGEKYTSMKVDFKAQLAEKDKDIRKLKSELADANAGTITVREKWLEVIADIEKAHAKELKAKDNRIKVLGDRVLEVERQRDDAKDKLLDKTRELYAALIELDEERGRNQKLTALLNQDYENSSIPSSMKVNRKKIVNSREMTGRKQGAQPGHEGHGRKKREATRSVDIPPLKEYAFSSDYIPTGKIITRQVVNISVHVDVDEYSTPEYINIHTGKRVHAPFPEGVDNDVNYGGSVKAFAYLLNNYCNVSIANVSNFLADLTGGELRISQGMINNLAKEFSDKTEYEQRIMFADIQRSATMGVDFSEVNINGKKNYVLVTATPVGVMFFARKTKGHKGIKDSPLDGYQGIVTHDHDKSFYKYGRAHQECLQHVLRYLLDSITNETNLTWSTQMRDLIREMIHFRKRLPDDGKNPYEAKPEKVKKFEKRYDEILELAEKEYEYEPPTKYYLKGFNLFKRLRNYRQNHLLFLYDWRVPHTNNHSERPLRKLKRKSKQVMAFRSSNNFDYLCRCMGVVESMRMRDENLFESIAVIFERSKGNETVA